VLDELGAGELSPEAQQRCEAHLAECSACRARKLALEHANATFYAAAPDLGTLSRIAAARSASEPAGRRAPTKVGWIAAPLLAACAALGFLAVQKPPLPAPSADTRTKGAARLGYFVKRGETVTRGEGTTVVHPRDAVRFVYSVDRAYYLAIFSADAHGVGVYFPSTRSAQLITAGQDVALDFSVQLDDTLGRERVTALFCPEPFEIDPVQSALSSGSALPASFASCERAAFELNKQAP
jgi:hypothetical protein